MIKTKRSFVDIRTEFRKDSPITFQTASFYCTYTVDHALTATSTG